MPYARSVRARLRAATLHADVDDSDKKMQKKVREAQLAQYNYILVRHSLYPPDQTAFLAVPELCPLALTICLHLLCPGWARDSGGTCHSHPPLFTHCCTAAALAARRGCC